MIPAWKIRREWLRFKQQLAAIPEFFTEPPARRRHDRAFDFGFPCSDGTVDAGDRIAIYLLFQPEGISDSTILTCQHLRDSGYATLVVSNAPLSEDDKTKLRTCAWRILERPNFGYDFGGYRDGIRQLMKWGMCPDHLLILNDSIWFPTIEKNSLITSLEDAGADLGGTFLRKRNHKEHFLESYLYHIPKRLFTSVEFKEFWDNLQITSNKYKVIRRGERGFSMAMLAAGKTVKGLYSTEGFLEALAAQETDFLGTTIHYAAHNYEEYEADRRALMSGIATPIWRKKALEHVTQSLTREYAYSAFPYAMVHLNNYPILKKSNDRDADLWRRAYLKAVSAGDIAPPPFPILEELQSKCRATPDL